MRASYHFQAYYNIETHLYRLLANEFARCHRFDWSKSTYTLFQRVYYSCSIRFSLSFSLFISLYFSELCFYVPRSLTEWHTHIPTFPLLLLVLLLVLVAACVQSMLMSNQKSFEVLYGTGVEKAAIAGVAAETATMTVTATAEAAVAALVKHESGRICMRAKAKANEKRTRFYRQTETLVHHSVPVSISLARSLALTLSVCMYI